MARKGKISELFDIASIEAEQAKVISLIDKYVSKVTAASSAKVVLKAAGKPSEILDGIKQVSAAQEQQSKIINQAVIVHEKAVAAKKAEEQASIELAKSLRSQTEAQEELNAAIESAARSGNQRAQLIPDQKNIENSAKAVTVYQDDLERLTGTLSENEQLQRLYKKELSEVQSELKLLDKVTVNSEKSTQKYRDKVAALTATETRLKSESKDLSRTIQLQVKEQNAAAGSLDRLRARYSLLIIEVDRLGATGQKSLLGQGLIAEANRTQAQIKKLEADTGRFQRNVGNYSNSITKAASGAFSALRNIAYLIPGLGIAGLISALINPLIAGFKTLFTRVNAVKDALRDLKTATNEASSESAKQVGVLKTLYSITQDSNQQLDDRKDASKEILSITKKQNEATGEHIKFVTDENGVLVANAIAYEQLTLSLVKTAKTKAYLSVIEEAYKKLVIEQNKSLTSQTTILQDVAVKGIQKTLPIFTAGLFKSKGLPEVQQALKSTAISNAEIYIKTLEDNLTKGLQSGELDLGGVFDSKGSDKQKKFFDDLLRLQRDAFLEIAKDEKIFISERITARKAAFEIDKQLTEGKRKTDIENAKGNAVDIANINALARAQEIKSERDKNKDILDLQNEFTRQLISKNKIGRDLVEKAKAEISGTAQAHRQSEHETELQDIQTRYDAELIELDKKYDKQRKRDAGNKTKLLLDEHEYNKNKLNIQLRLQRDLLLEDIKFTKQTIELAEVRALASGKQEDIDAVAAAKSKLAALEVKLLGIITDAAIKGNEERKKSDKELFDEKVKQFEELAALAKEVFSIASSFSGIAAEKEKNAIQDQIDLLEEKKQKDIEVANQTILNAQDRAAAITVIEARAAAEREQLEIRKRQAQERQARFDKAATIASIILETALAVIRALGDKATPGIFGRIAGAVIIGALGAAKLAVAIATPIPRYRTGGVHKGGLGEVGHGKPEGVQLPDGTIFKTPSTPTILDMPKGTVIHSDFEKMILGASLTKLPVFKETTRSDRTELAVNKMEKSVVGAIKKIPQQNITVQNIISKRIRSSGSIINYITRKDVG